MGRSIGEEKIMGGMDGRVGWMCMIWKRRKTLVGIGEALNFALA